jgi:hypothetical protein
VEFLAKETALLENLEVVDGLLLHHGYHPELIAIWVFLLQVLITQWHGSRLAHQLPVMLQLVLELLLDDSLKCSLVFDLVVLLLDELLGTPLPVL